MLEEFWRNLKSGSDIRGVATSMVGNTEINLTNEVIEKIMVAFGIWIAEKTELEPNAITVAIGHDSRISANRIKNVCINTLRSMGINVYDCSLASTPAMYMAISTLKCSAAIEITASHHPADRNGLKFFTSEGGISAENIEDILEKAQNITEIMPSAILGNVRKINLMDYYCEKIKKLITDNIKCEENKKPLENINIVVDAGNGAAGFFVENILKPLGANTEKSQFLEPDGTFPNHVPNPENNEAIESIVALTKNSDADLGIIFDTDVDRVAVVGKGGKLIADEKLIALASLIALKNNPNAIIVTDSVTSDYLEEFIRKNHGTQFRYKRGYNNVISMAKKINAKGGNCPLAIETSGHAAFRENNFIDDGAYLAAKIIIEMTLAKSQGKNICDLIKDLSTAKEKKNIRIKIDAQKYSEYADKILNHIKNYANSKHNIKLDNENIEGVRINFTEKRHKGWAMFRKSLHDPEIVIHAESEVAGGLREIFKIIKSCLGRFDMLDKSQLQAYK